MADNDAKANSTRGIRHLKDFSPAERRAFLDSFDRVFCDCDGVVWESTQASIPGTGKAVSYLQALGKDVVFVTNNSLRLAEDHLSKFKELGISVTKEQLLHPAQSIVNYLSARNFEGLIYCIGSGPFKKTLTSAGFNLIDGPNRMLDGTLKDLCANVFQNDPVTAVVIDVDLNLSVTKLMRAHRYLKNPNCLFIAGAADILIPIGSEDVIGAGLFIKLLEQATKRKATMLGKPGSDLCDLLIKQCNVVDPRRALFIGDILDSDVQFGKMCGFQTMLVLTGGTKKKDLLGELSEGETPDYCVDSLADLNDFV